MNLKAYRVVTSMLRLPTETSVSFFRSLGLSVLVFLITGCGDEEKPPIVPPPDSTPPAAITDLRVGTVRVTDVGLTWSAPSDDGDAAATTYDLRYAAAAIDSSIWELATQVAALPSPGEPGSIERFTVTGLDPGTTYYFGLRSADDASNWSEISNVVEATTESPYAIWSDQFGAPPDGAGTDGPLKAFLEFNGDLIVGGHFGDAGQITGASNIARWDGTSWHAFGSGAHGLVWAEVTALIEYQGDLIAAGSFSEIGGVAASNIARWDGASWTPLGQGANEAVMCLEIFEGDLIAGGWFRQAGGVDADLVARWNGEEWSPMGAGLHHPDTNIPVWDLLVFNGDLYAGGGFIRSGGSTVGQVARWDGQKWTGVGSAFSQTGSEFPSVRSLLGFYGQIYAAGRFSHIDGIHANGVARWDGSDWTALGTGVGGEFAAGISLGIFRDDLILGGSFTSVSGYPAANVARWDGATWHALGSGVTSSGYSDVSTQVVWNGDLYFGGTFDQAGGYDSRNIARLIPLRSEPSSACRTRFLPQSGS